MWFLQIVRSFFYTLDSNLFNFIPTVYDLLILISRTSILNQAQIKEFAERIQMLLGVFMLFKVSFSLITYVINPDEFSDKSKGFGKLWQNVIISLLMLVLVPYAFNMAYDFQAMILEDNTLAKLIFGENSDKNYIGSAGNQMAYTIMIPFFSPDVSQTGLSSCVNLTEVDSDGTVKFNGDCRKGLYKAHNDGEEKSGKETYLENYIMGVENSSLGLTFRLDIAKKIVKPDKTNEAFLINYNIPVSTVVAVVTLLLLVSFCLDVALRSVKLAFLQLIAPIPIISFIDPKSGKDGIFKKWYQMCFSTYLSLFIRLTALYFGIYIISKVNVMYDVINGSTVDNGWVKIFIVIGVLMFIKQLPKILEGLGIKLGGDGKFTLNPFKKFGEEAIGGKRFLGAAGGIVSGTADRAARVASAKGFRGKAAALAGSFVGIPGAAVRGFRDGKGFSSGMSAQNAVNRRLREGRVNGLTPMQSYLDYAGSKFGLDDATLEREGRYLNMNESNLKKAKSEIETASRKHNLDSIKLEQSNAVRKDTQSKLSNVKSKGQNLQKFNEDFVKKKANFGRNANDDAILSAYSSRKGVATSTDVQLSDGTRIKKGEVIDDQMLARIERSANKNNYSQLINSDNFNLDLMKKMQPGQTLAKDVMIGDKVFSKGSIVDGKMLEDARQAAYDYEKYATKQVHDMFANGGVRTIGNSKNAVSANSGDYLLEAQQVFDNLRNEYKGAVGDANTALSTYDSTYGTSTTALSDNVDYKRLDASVKDLEHGTVVTDMAIESEKIDRQIADHKREIERIKHDKTVEYIDEKGKKSDVSIDEFESLQNPRKEKHQSDLKKHQERRSLFTNMKK